MGALGEVSGRVALVTGAAHGIGAATARRLASAGATVIAVDLDAKGLGQTVQACGPHTIRPIVVDLLEPGATERVVAEAIAVTGKLDILVSNAGFNSDAPIASTTDDQWETMLELLVTVPFRLSRALAAHFKARAAEEDANGGPIGYRKLVTIAALEGVTGRPGAANYSAANAALIGLTNALAREWARIRVTANALAFGPVQTRLLVPEGSANRLSIGGREIQGGIPRVMLEHVGLPAQDASDDVYRIRGAVGGASPLTADTAADAIAFYCSPASDAISGTMHAVGIPRRL